MIIEVRRPEGQEATGTFLLVVEQEGQYGSQVGMTLSQRIDLARQLLETIPPPTGHDPKEGSISELLTMGYEGLREYQEWEKIVWERGAKNRAMNACKRAKATDAESARVMVNKALGRPDTDRSQLSHAEWDRAYETIRTGVPS